ncbi:hypothetical protein Mesil_1750 [Allomeiothermus silvanus DSM 9946]|uniref:Uncharacterized protein n=1 Tax=Allomeiothermus silvanus (strain ATCC 700542 / DSM 9946 / NBRC 106475 / NCIMB 13440 / VI-R2) TaxID=526227 RepID=D7BFS5_ALLS1|nr:hypothetical protein [Allomeiothermus silvanus]ADH63628.1 hypothetical protein Mesil_1750 [Allomeiothermus silvanus DSM 9946]
MKWSEHAQEQARASRDPRVTEAFLRIQSPGHRARMVERRLETLGYSVLLNQRGPELWMAECYYVRGQGSRLFARPVARQTGKTRLGALLAICGELGVVV